MKNISTSSVSAYNISTAIAIGTWTADQVRNIFVRAFLGTAASHLVAGGGNYSIYLTVQRAGSGETFSAQPVTTSAVASGVFSLMFTTIPLPVNTGDVVSVLALGLSGDTSVDCLIEIWDDCIPNAAPAASGGVLTVGTGSGQLNPSSGNVGVTGDFSGTMKTSAETAAAAAVTAAALATADQLSTLIGEAFTYDTNNLPIFSPTIEDWAIGLGCQAGLQVTCNLANLSGYYAVEAEGYFVMLNPPYPAEQIPSITVDEENWSLAGYAGPSYGVKSGTGPIATGTPVGSYAGNSGFTATVTNFVPGGGTGLTAQQTRDAMSLASTAGSPAAGSIDAELLIIQSRVTTTPIQAIVLVQPGGAIELQQYASYKAERGNALVIPNPGGWLNLTGADIHLLVAAQQAGAPVMPPVMNISGGTVEGTDAAPTGVSFDIPSSDTAELINFTKNAYAYCLVAWYSSNGDQVPLTDWANCTATPGIQLTS